MTTTVITIRAIITTAAITNPTISPIFTELLLLDDTYG